MADPTHRALNIPNRVERLPVSRFTWSVVLLAGLAWFVESLSIGSLGVALPVLKQVMQLTPSASGILVASSTFGIVIGLIPAGFLSDKYGRKKILVWGIVEYSVLTLLCAASVNFPMLLIFRFLSGLGMGAVFPLPYAIVGEFVNSRSRTLFNGVMDAFLSIGYFIAPLLGLVILPNLSPGTAWRVFFVVSAAPLVYAYAIHKFLPESPRWLERKGRYDVADATMRSIESRVEKSIHHSLPKAQVSDEMVETIGRVSAAVPWTRKYIRRTVVRCVAATGTFFMFYIVMTYMPTIFKSKGLSFAHSLLFTAIITGAAIPGKLLNGYLAEKMGRKSMYVTFMGLAGLGALFFGVAVSPGAMILYACIMSFFGTGAFPALKMSYAEQYPTPIRTTGAASVETIGRFLGGVVGSYAMPVILSAAGVATGFYVIAIVTFIAVAVGLIFAAETKNRTLEQLESGVTF